MRKLNYEEADFIISSGGFDSDGEEVNTPTYNKAVSILNDYECYEKYKYE